MDMGTPEITAARFQLPLSTGPRDVTLLWVGNPQCAVPVDDFDFDWRAMGAEIERIPISPTAPTFRFVKPVDEHIHRRALLGARRGRDHELRHRVHRRRRLAVARGMAQSPVRVLTPAGPLICACEASVYLTGPAV